MKVCKRCQETETVMHTFFFCPFARNVWENIPIQRVVHLATDKGFKDAITEFQRIICLPPTGISGSILPWVCWSIWTARNTLLFEETPSVEEVASKALRLAQEWTLAQGLKQQSYKPAEKQNEETRNRIDQSAYTICKTDASWEKHSKRAGLAWIITAPTCTTISKESIIQTSVNSPLIAEALALRSGLLTAVAKGITNLLMLTDNSTFVRAINNDMKSP